MNLKRVSALLLTVLLLAACSRPSKTTPEAPPAPPAEGGQPAEPNPPAKEKGTQPVSGLFEKVALKPGDPLPGVGLYFIDTATGAVEGWRPPSELRFAHYQVGDDNRFIGVRADAGHYLIDRASGAVAAVGGYLVAAAGGRLLMNESRDSSWASPRYSVLDTDQNLVARFELPKAGSMARAVISPDGAKAMLATYLPQGSQALLYLVDLASGKVELVADLESAVGGQDVIDGLLMPIPGTQELLFSLSSLASGRPGYQSLLLRLDWQGKKLLEKRVEGHGVGVSPDGRHLYWLADVAGYPGAVVLADLNGEPRFRAKVFTMGVEWLTDGSGYLVIDQGTYKRVTPRGEVEPFPLCARVDCRAGLTAAPDRTDLFLIGHEQVVTAEGKTAVTVALGAPQTRVAARLKPFGATSRELRVQVEPEYGGDGWDGYYWALPLQIERPPFDDRLLVKGTGDCLNLRAKPDRKAAVIACLPDGTPLTVAENRGTERTSLLWGDGGQWVYVRTERGEQGWAALWSGYVTWLH